MRALIFSLLAIRLSAASFYVATNGLDSNSGTIGSPYLTISKGLASAQAGDTVFIGQGDYRVGVDSVRNGTLLNPITLDGQGISSFWYWRNQHSYQKVINCMMVTTNGPLPNGLCHLSYNTATATGCIVSNCVINGGYVTNGEAVLGCAGVLMNATSTNNMFVNNVISNLYGATCVTLTGYGNIVRSNRILNTFDVDCLRFFEGVSNRFDGNVFSNEVQVTGNFHGDCFQCFASSSGSPATTDWLFISGNTFIDSAVQIGNMEEHNTTGGPTNIYTNIFIFNNQFVRTSSDYGSSVPNIMFANNTFVECGWNKTGFMLLNNGTDTKGAADRTKVFNNAFVRCKQGTNDPLAGWYSFASPSQSSNCEADYNYAIGYTNSPKSMSEPHGKTNGSPGFVNDPGGDYRLTQGSQLASGGTNLSSIFTTDFSGHTRAAWGIGAFEFMESNLNISTLNVRTIQAP